MEYIFVSTLILLLTGITLQQDVCSTLPCIKTAANIEANMNKDVNPCEDFYSFACGRFADNADLSSYYPENSTFLIMGHNVDRKVKALLEKPYITSEANYVKYMKDYYQSCMNTEKIDKNGNANLVNILKSANLYNDYSNFDAPNSFITLVNNGIFTGFFLDFFVAEDPTNTSRNILTVRPHLGGMLNDVYYKKGVDNDAVKAENTALTNILAILGLDSQTAKTEIKKVQQNRVNLANSPAFNDASYKRMTLKQFDDLFPNYDCKKIFSTSFKTLLSDDEPVIVYAPSFLDEVKKVVFPQEKQTLAFHFLSNIISTIYPFLSSDIRNAAFEVEKVLYGVEAEKPREIFCVNEVAKQFDVGLSSHYILNYYSPAKKAKVTDVHAYILDAFLKSIKNSNVFTDKVKEAALRKAKMMKKFLIYPEEYLNDNLITGYYNTLKYSEHSCCLHKVLELYKYKYSRKFNMLNQINNNDDFSIFGDTTEVYSDYVGVRNLFRTTDAFVQEPLYINGAPNYVLFGYLGMPLGHEVSMALDSNNIKRDDRGNLNSFMDKASTEKYDKTSQCLIDHYNKLSVNGLKINGEKTLAENMADVYSLNLAYEAYQTFASDYNLSEGQLPNLQYSPEQMLFISAANIFCTKTREAYLRHFIETDHHSARLPRVNGMIANNKYFGNVFNCPTSSAMNIADKCSLY